MTRIIALVAGLVLIGFPAWWLSEVSVPGSVGPTQMQSAWHALLEDVELMPQDQDFGFQPPSRLEAVVQHADHEEANCDHQSRS